MIRMDYPTYEEITNPSVRYWNICNTLFNINEEHSEQFKRDYLKKFDDKERFSIYLMLKYIAVKGHSYVKREIFREEPVGE